MFACIRLCDEGGYISSLPMGLEGKLNVADPPVAEEEEAGERTAAGWGGGRSRGGGTGGGGRRGCAAGRRGGRDRVKKVLRMVSGAMSEANCERG